MEILIKAAQLILSLSILVTLHELGHFLPAKWFKTRVDKFYLFFDFLFPLPNIAKFAIFKKKIGDTEYGLGWFPLGGYVQINGMVDESMDKETLAQPPQPWEFRSKPAWQRLIIMIGGVVVNLLLGVFLYSMILFTWGEKYLPTANATYGIACDSLATQLGLVNGDVVMSVAHKPVEDFGKIAPTIILEEATSIQVSRAGQLVDIQIPKGFVRKLIDNKMGGFISPRIPFIIEKFGPGSVAEKSGIMKGDQLLGINDVSAPYFQEFKKLLKNYKNQTVQIDLKRNGQDMKLAVAIPESGLLGVMPRGELDKFFTVKKTEYSLLTCYPAGARKSIEVLSKYAQGLNQIVKSIFGKSEMKASESVGGFLSIGDMFSPVWDWESFWNLTAILSLVLAVMNILPIPALDGGHVVFCLWEMITKRKPNDMVLEYAQYAGMAFLFFLMIFANGNDIYRYFIK